MATSALIKVFTGRVIGAVVTKARQNCACINGAWHHSCTGGGEALCKGGGEALYKGGGEAVELIVEGLR